MRHGLFAGLLRESGIIAVSRWKEEYNMKTDSRLLAEEDVETFIT